MLVHSRKLYLINIGGTSMSFKHRDETITMDEAPSFKEATYTVDGGGKIVYKAESKYGKSFAQEPKTALDGAKEQIDRAKDGAK